MQASQIATGLRQFRTICTPFPFLFVGVRVRLRTLSFGAKRCTLKADKGNKKVPQIIEFVGLVCLLSGIVRLVLRRDRDSNPGCLAAQRFSRPPQSTTLPPLLKLPFREVLSSLKRCKGTNHFNSANFLSLFHELIVLLHHDISAEL